MRDYAMDTSRGSIYDHDIPSLSASLEAFDPERSMHSAYSGRSNMHSSRWSIPPAEDMESEAESDGPWAPPAWQKSQSSNNWYRKSLLSESARPSASRSPSYYREVTPSRIPLPESPMKQTPRTSPEPMSEEEQRYFPDNIASRLQRVSEEPHPIPPVQHQDEPDPSHHEAENLDGFVRFAIRGETLFRTAPIEDTISTFASGTRFFTRSRWNIAFTIMAAVFAWALVQPWTATLIPDVANVANMVKQFEPLMYASENVIPRSRELSSASIAVQDLGESVRAINMSSSPVILNQLDDLADSLKILSEQMTSFFVNVDGDMDSILITMEWAARELSSISNPRIGVMDTVIDNVHGGLAKIGLLTTSDGSPNAAGRIVGSILGHTTAQRSRATTQRIFDSLLGDLEENIASELSRADTLFHLFESVERQFQNLHRSVAKEEDSLANQKEEFLASMWRNTISNKLRIKKYEKNLSLLASVRSSTLNNKSELKEHIQIIRSVKEQLDKTRKKIISPLIRRAQSNSWGLEEQLEGLKGTYGYLKGLRDGQKKKVLSVLWEGKGRRISIESGETPELEGGDDA